MARKYVTVVNSLIENPKVARYLSEVVTTHIPSEEAEWIPLSKINVAAFRSLPDIAQIAVLKLHYSGAKPFGAESIAIAQHAVACGKHLTVQIAC